MNFLHKYKENISVLLLVILSSALRLINLGYSDYQGDEIKALFTPATGQGVMQFLLDQRKGPLQFLITYLIKFINYDYSNQLLTRLPFALAGILSVYFFYKFVKIHFNSKVALYAAFFLATNGFIIAFSRIAQYQSFVILFCVLTLYFLTLCIVNPKFKYSGLYLGFTSWAIAFLAHYDAVFILPAILYILYKNYSLRKAFGEHRIWMKNLFLSASLFAVLLLWFYIPFAFSLTDATKDYWSGRLSGDVSSKLSSSRYLFTVYQPIYVIHIYTALFGTFVLGLLSYILRKKLPRLAHISLIRPYNNFIYVIAIWCLLGVLFWELLVYIPGTHIYTYLLPLFILLAVGVSYIENLAVLFSSKLPKILKNSIYYLTYISLVVVGVFIFLQSFAIFVENRQEYPWEDEKFLIWTFPKPTPIFHLSMFGFPYFRNWEDIKDFVNNQETFVAYSTNERDSIARFYILSEKDTDKAGYYIFIKNPQSFTNEIIQKKAAYWASKYEPVYTFSRSGETLVAVYLMQPGTLEEITAKGY